MPKSLRITLIALAALLGLALGYAWFAAPRWMAGSVQQRLVERAAKRGIDLRIGAFFLDPTTGATLDQVELRDATQPSAPPFVQVRRVEIAWQINGLFRPRLWLERVRILAPQVAVRRSVDGKLSVDALIRRLLEPRPDDDDDKGGSGGLRQYLSRHVPDVEIRGLSATFDDESSAGPARVAGVDLRHLRLHDARLDLRNISPVQEITRIKLDAEGRVAGVVQPIQLTGQVEWPESEGPSKARQGEVTLRLPGDIVLETQGYRVQLASVTLRSDGRVVLGHVRAAKAEAGGHFALDVREVVAHLSRVAGPEPNLPEELKDKLPAPARQLLRHVTEVAIEEPVIVAQRQPPRPGARPEDEDDDEAQPEPPPVPGGPVNAVVGKGVAGKGAVGKGKAQPSAKQKAIDKEKERKEADGRKVREHLAGLFSKGSDRLKSQLDKLRVVLAGIPVPVVSVHHGRARYSDEAQGPAGDISDFNVRVERKPGEDVVTAQLDFNVPQLAGQGGPPAANKVWGRVDTRTGDAELKLQLDHLPIAPYAAVLPPSLTVEPTSAVRSMALSVLYTAGTGQLTLEGKGTVSQVHLDAQRISRKRLMNLTIWASGKLDLDLQKQTVRLDGGELVVGKVHFLLAGDMQRYRTAPAFHLQLKVPTVECQDVVAAIPQGFADMLEGMKCEGRLSYAVTLGLDTANMNSLQLEIEPELGEVRITDMGKYIRFDVFSGPFEHHARQKDGTLHTFVTGPGTDLWVPYDGVNPYFIRVITTTEDGGFFGHRGFSFDSFKNAAIENLKRGRFARGASTITQQLVKNLFFVEREKTISRKVQEAVVTWQIERTLPKQQMMELYLNIIELGPRIYGIKAASQHYFNRPPAELTLLQALWLGSIIPNPRAFYHQFREGSISENWRTYLCWIAEVMLKREKITEDEFRRLGECNVVFGGGPDGSEAPPDEPLGHEGDPSLGDPAVAPPADKRLAPSVPPDQQP